ncbi:MAG: polymerase subunit beta [Frankiales bacterium]|nr:polymerase subunit beta [Frankiales bacterium]
MRFTVERDVLADAVAWAARTLPARPPVPVLAGLLLDVEADRVTVSGFDYEVSATVSTPAEVSERGKVLVSGRLLADITRSLPAQPVELVTDGTRVTLTCGSARFQLPTLPVEDYPTLPDLPATSGTVGSDVFAAAVASVAIAAGRDDTLPVLTGVRVEIEGDRLTLAATDRYRLAVREMSWQPTTADMSAVALVPARTLHETARALTTAAQVTIALATGGAGEGMVGFAGGERRTTTRLLDGEFPKYRSLLPSEHSAVAEVDTAQLVEAVKRVSLVAQRNTPITLAFTAGEVRLEAGAADDARAAESVAAQLDGDDITIAFNPTFLLDGLGAIDSDTARLSFTAATKPAVITGKPGDTGDDYRYLIMPVRLAG